MNRKSLWIAPTFLTLVSSLATAAKLEEVVVTAQKREETVRDVPIAITAVNRELLETTGINSSLEVAAVTPGLVMTEGSGSLMPTIRGVGSRSATPGNEAPTAGYMDGVYLTDKSGLLLSGYNDVESIEILRGPQGTLFGRNATGGAIVVKTRGPSRDLQGSVQATYGDSIRGANLFVSGPLSDEFSASLSAYREVEDGYIDNLNPANGAGSKVDGPEGSGVRAKILWEPGSDFSALLALDYLEVADDSRMSVQAIKGAPQTLSEAVAAGFNIPIPDTRKPRVYAGNVNPDFWHRENGAALTLEWIKNDLDIKSITSYRADYSGTTTDVDESPLPIFYLEGNKWYGYTFQQEFTFSFDAGGPLTWVGGLYYFDQSTGYSEVNQSVGIGFPVDFAEIAADTTGTKAFINGRSNIDIASIAAYGEANYELTDRLKLTLGLRYTEETHELGKDNRTLTTVGDGTGAGTLTFTSTAADKCATEPDCDLEANFSEVTYRGVIAYDISDDIMTYASYNKGFKSGVFNISAADTVTPTEPEILDTFEVGFKASLLDSSLNLNTAFFYNDYSEMQVVLTDPASGLQRIVNAASATTSGFEIDLQWRPIQNLYVQAGGSTFFEAEYEKFDNCEVYGANPAGGLQIVRTDCSGQRLPVTPDYTLFLSGAYTIELGSAGNVILGALVSYTDEYYFAPVGAGIGREQPQQIADPIVNLNATWQSPDDVYSIKVWGKNVTDVDQYAGMLTTPFGFDSNYNRGASYGVTVGYKL